ncbi:MAG TPA: sodium:alanine symporter family protein [Bacteroidales bacterium]|nr:sodium:alanine symporter family protein [Bacteroidales bacterium]
MNSFLENFDYFIQLYNEYVGGYLILALLVPTGIYYSIRLKFLQISHFKHAIDLVRGRYSKKSDTGDVSHFKALTTALSGTVGTGNIVGVTLAIYYGGPGAIFWLWVTGFFGMMLKMVECTLAQKYRKINADGTVSGGPMYYIELGLKEKLGVWAKRLAVVFAFAGILCSFGTGNMAQANSISDVLNKSYNIPVLYTGLTLSALVFLIVVGGLKRIANVTSRLVPFMAVVYITSALIVIGVHISDVPAQLALIVKSAFTGHAATGGFVGSTFFMTIVWGVRRGLFSNEAGQGSAPMAHAAAKTPYPMREGFVASLEPFIDTLVICTITSLVILLTDVWSADGAIKGVGMTVAAFQEGLREIGLGFFAHHMVAISLLLFAFSTIISWSYYGTRTAQYIFGDKAIKPYYYVFTLFVFFGSVWGIDLVWHFVDMVITFMSIPNLIALLLLFPVMKAEAEGYLKRLKAGEFNLNRD